MHNFRVLPKKSLKKRLINFFFKYPKFNNLLKWSENGEIQNVYYFFKGFWPSISKAKNGLSFGRVATCSHLTNETNKQIPSYLNI